MTGEGAGAEERLRRQVFAYLEAMFRLEGEIRYLLDGHRVASAAVLAVRIAMVVPKLVAYGVLASSAMRPLWWTCWRTSRCTSST